MELTSSLLNYLDDSEPQALKPGRASRLATFFIIATLIGAFVAGGLVVETVVGSGPVVTIGAVEGSYVSGQMHLFVPVSVRDGGFLTVDGVELRVNISDYSGDVVIFGSSPTFDVPAKSEETKNITLFPDFSHVAPDTLQSMLTSGQNLTFSGTLAAGIYPLVRLSGSLRGFVPWGALMANLTFGTPTIRAYNSTYSELFVPYSFVNANQYFHLTANVTGTITDQAGNRVGSVLSSPIDVRRGDAFNGTLRSLVLSSSLNPTPATLVADLSIDSPNLFAAPLEVTING